MTTTVLSVRVNDNERSLLEAAAQNTHAKLSDFIRRKALEAAEEEIMEHRRIEIPAEKWEEIEEFAAAPAKEVAAVKEVFRFASEWKA